MVRVRNVSLVEIFLLGTPIIMLTREYESKDFVRLFDSRGKAINEIIFKRATSIFYSFGIRF